MAIKNFINEIQAAGILKERDAVTVAVANCNRNYEGDIKGKGDRVKIKSVGDVSIKQYTRNTDIDDPEEATDSAQWLDITEEEYFNVQVDDVDDAQSDEEILPELRRKAGIGFANSQDAFIFGKYTEAGTTLTQNALTSANVFSEMTKILRAMQRNNVPAGMKIVLEISPEVASKLILAKIVKDTDNSQTIKNGKIGEFFGMDIYVSTNIVISGSGETVQSHCLARTKDAITFAEQFTKLETYRPEKRFANAIKGIQVYGAKVVRPKELIHLNWTCAAESAI
jgi:hypothetical protein